MNVEFI